MFKSMKQEYKSDKTAQASSPTNIDTLVNTLCNEVKKYNDLTNDIDPVQNVKMFFANISPFYAQQAANKTNDWQEQNGIIRILAEKIEKIIDFKNDHHVELAKKIETAMNQCSETTISYLKKLLTAILPPTTSNQLRMN